MSRSSGINCRQCIGRIPSLHHTCSKLLLAQRFKPRRDVHGCSPRQSFGPLVSQLLRCSSLPLPGIVSIITCTLTICIVSKPFCPHLKNRGVQQATGRLLSCN